MHHQMKLKAMKKNPDTEFVLKKNLENDLVPDEQQNDALIPEANIHLVKGAESEANDEENNVKLKQ